MPDFDDLRAALTAEEEHAPSPGSVAADVAARRRTRKVRQQRYGLIAVAATVVVVATTTTLVVNQTGRTAAPPASTTSASATTVTSATSLSVSSTHQATITSAPSPTPSPSSAPTRPATTGLGTAAAALGPASTKVATSPVSAADLAGGRWSALPPAPIQGRTGSVGVWTGTTMIVWGGFTNGVADNDGASYNPTTKTWEKLPPSPLSGRSDPIAIWTGTELFLWGGQSANSSAYSDGAIYNPATHTWRKLPAVEVPAGAETAAAWAGREVVLAATAVTGTQRNVVVLRAFDPIRNVWSNLPSAHLDNGGQIGQLYVSPAGDRIALFALWSTNTAASIPGGLEYGSGIGLFTLAGTDTAWHQQTWPAGISAPLAPPVWTGDTLLLPLIGIWCGPAESCPAPFGFHAATIDVRNNAGTALPAQPGSAWRPYAVLWTGSSILGIATSNGTVSTVSAYDLTARAWKSLPSTPQNFSQAVVVWTGTSIIAWGQSATGAVTAGYGEQLAPH